MKKHGWKKLTIGYPDPHVTETINGICDFGARIGYQGERIAPTIHPNLKTAEDEPNIVTSDIESERSKGQLKVYAREKSYQPITQHRHSA